MAAADGAPAPKGDLGTRTVVGAALAAVALGAIWGGGWLFALLVTAGVVLVLLEWAAMHDVPLAGAIPVVLLLAAAMLVAAMGDPGVALLLLFVGVGLLTLVAVSFGPRGRMALVAGLLYAGLAGVALIWLRGLESGLHLILWTMAIVWATDIFAYFSGRAIGGPKLAPRISPKKTWAGLGGGVLAAAVASALLGIAFGWPTPPALLAIAGAALALVSQGGDLFESWLKRRRGVKDSGRILPGHGGVMDRVDGLVPVAMTVALWQAATGSAA